jgi:hypothetical protein
MTHWAHAHEREHGLIDLARIGEPRRFLNVVQLKRADPPPSTNNHDWVSLDDELEVEPVQDQVELVQDQVELVQDQVYPGAGTQMRGSILIRSRPTNRSRHTIPTPST